MLRLQARQVPPQRGFGDAIQLQIQRRAQDRRAAFRPFAARQEQIDEMGRFKNTARFDQAQRFADRAVEFPGGQRSCAMHPAQHPLLASRGTVEV
jgi:hypothetical protein